MSENPLFEINIPAYGSFKESLLSSMEKLEVEQNSLKKRPELVDTSLISHLTASGKHKLIAMSKKLTSFERACLTLLLQGKSQQTIAKQLQIGPALFESCFDCMMEKLDCECDSELLSCAKQFFENRLL